MRKINVAIDGHSACGKSTTARGVAAHLGYTYVDSGAMYRAVTLYLLDNKIAIEDGPPLYEALAQIHIDFRLDPDMQERATFLNNVNVESQIRTMRIAQSVSAVSAIAAVRSNLVAQQQAMGRKKGIVMDGRDIGTVVLPEADLKVFMTADFEVRALRRQKELKDRGKIISIEEVRTNLSKRDHLDSTREESPLRQAKDAILIDTTHLTLQQQIDRVVELAQDIISSEVV